MGSGNGHDREPFGDRLGYEPEQLSLTDDDSDRLPWLESGEYEDDERALDTGRLLGFALVAFLLLAAALGAFWWFSRASSGNELQPEGTLIAAEAGPYKVRPTDPGGKVFEGTGDTSFAVGEGQTREGTLAAKGEPAPSVIPSPTSTPSASPSAQASPEPTVVAAGASVQVGAYASQAAADAGWVSLQRQTDKLSGVSHRVVKGTADIGTVYRLQALPGDITAARQLCAALKADGVACQVKR